MWRINSVEEITTTTTESVSETEDEEEDYYHDLDVNAINTPIKVPFPEAGIDIIDANVDGCDVTEELLQQKVIKWFDSENWEENWLFKKRKKTDSKSDLMLGYMAMILAELPVCMLIPNPNHKLRAMIGERELDELSELSEHNSVGSLEFSDDESDYENDVINGVNGEEVLNHKNNEYIETEIMTTISKPDDNRNKDSNEAKVIKTVGNKDKKDNKVKPIVKLVTKVPKFMPKELRMNESIANSDPYLVLKPMDASVQSGITVQFCSRAKGSKPLLFSWFKNDSILKSDENFRIFQSGEENVLEIKKTSADYSAQYSCVVYNRFGYQWSDFTLEVKDSSFQSNKMPNNKQKFKSKTVSDCGVNQLTNNPKHEKQKTRPIVIQRTWAERVAELQNINPKSKAQSKQIEEKFENIDESDKENDTNISSPISGSIAEREHKKWQNPDIELKNNPYSTENLNLRREQRALILSSGEDLSHPIIEETIEDEDGVDTAFLSSKSKDLSRYKKDFFVKEKLNKDETLRSSEENEYSKFLNSNQMERKSSEDMSQISEISIDRTSNGTESQVFHSDSDSMLPSVKDLVNRFSVNNKQNDRIPKILDIKSKNSSSDSKLNIFNKNLQTNQQNFKVHSLTARSLTKEFREMSQINIPRTDKRMGINGQNRPNSLVESESSSPSTTTCSPTNEGYASDESNTSSNVSNSGHLLVKNKANIERTFSQSILKRASYWQKRCEQGLISDNSVNEEFPPMETIAD